ncbi:Endo-chitosanase B [Lachnellula willkommii]|uniref:Endo-chitosanase n=1 Tax=Lachnellula willkommii TaxID=215461 RepID=A0A559MBY3_9HELO|nr:Endo-chitosanase B [Lachnellula willkommii]
MAMPVMMKQTSFYIAFTGKDAVPGASAAWDADSATDFESSIKSLGNKLIQRIGGGSGTAPNSSNFTAPATTSKTLTKSEGSTGIKSSSAGASTSTRNCACPGHCAGKSHVGCCNMHARMRMIALTFWFVKVLNALNDNFWALWE